MIEKKIYMVTELTGESDGLEIYTVKPESAPPVPPKKEDKSEAIITKKATTIMPKEVFNALQMYCTQTETPKHRALYRFIIDGLHNAGHINDTDYRRFCDMAAQLTTTYEKK